MMDELMAEIDEILEDVPPEHATVIRERLEELLDRLLYGTLL